MTANPEPHDTLDPQDWETFRALAHQMLDDAVDYIELIRKRPVWKAMRPCRKSHRI